MGTKPLQKLTHWCLYLYPLAWVAFAPLAAQAIPPNFVSDEDLANYPIIVAGKWNKVALRDHSRTEDDARVGKVLKDTEVHTELVVERVIKGDIKPGTHKILLGFRIGWAGKDGGPVMSFMSTEMMGDVKEVTETNLWFLVPKRSWDKTDPKTYLALETYRGVQPVALEKYFLALTSVHAKAQVTKLLITEEPVVIERVLTYLSGGTLPWPYEPDRFDPHRKVKQRKEPMPVYAPDIEKLLDRKPAEVRRLAAAVYADLAGESAIPRMRQLLGDSDATVRAIAVGHLLRRDDPAPGEAICRAVRGIQEGGMACKLVELLRRWKDPHAVVALIEFLQNDDFAYQIGDDLGVPALKAQAALKERTGYDFPTDVEAARIAWEDARAISNAEKRVQHLALKLPYDSTPLTGKLVKDAMGEALILTNRSKQSVAVAKRPGIEYRWTNGVGGGASDGRPENKDAFTTLAPGDSMRVDVNSQWTDRSRLKSLMVYFLSNGNRVGFNAWIGKVVLQFDPK